MSKEKESSEKCLFSCESTIDGYEYKKMAKYFPKRMYWVFVIRGTILNVIITALIAIITQSWIVTLIFLLVYEVYLMIYYKLQLEPMAEKVHNARLKRGEIEVDFETEFKILLPTQFRSNENVYYSIYNKTTNEYNTIPNETGEYEIYSMYYNKLLKQLSIHKYKYKFNK